MNNHFTNFVYIAPADKTIVPVTFFINAAKSFQAWLRWQMGNGQTFTIGSIRSYQSVHTADWFSTNDPSQSYVNRWPTVYPLPYNENARRTLNDNSGWFWANSLDELANLAGGGFGQPNDTWVTYVDAPLAHGQYVGGTSIGYSGVAVLPEEDVLAIQGLPTPHHYTQCREFGGMGHELLHTLGIPHPDGDPDYWKALMGVGYSLYPNCILTQSERDQLGTNPFIGPMGHLSQVPGLCNFNDMIINPRPKPVIRPRP